MVIAIFNNSGNVGKSTIAREALAAHMEKCNFVEVETHNHGNKKYAEMFYSYAIYSAIEFEAIYTALVDNIDANFVLDIGSSNVIDFMRQLNTYSGIESMIDFFIIPTTKDAKQLADTIKTISTLTGMDIEASKISVVCNRANPDSFESDFSQILKAAEKIGFKANRDLMIRETSTLKDLEIIGRSLTDIMKDETDYRAKIIETKGQPEQKKWIKMDLAKMASKKVYEDFSRVYAAIVGDK